MVKSIIYTLVAVALSVGFFIWTEYYIDKQFDEMGTALQSLYDKIEDKTATREDGYAVREVWNVKKEKLHVFIPHNDISYIDYWLNEACALVYNDKYELALGKIEVLLDVTQRLPDAYKLKLENIF